MDKVVDTILKETSEAMAEIEKMESGTINNMLPTMYNGCVEVNEKIQKCPQLREALTRCNLDNIVVAWTGIFLHSVYHIFKDLRREGEKNWDNSMLFCGLSSQAMQLDWLIYSACYGQYDLALRELRNILESAFLFYRADCDEGFKNKSLEEKAKQLDELKRCETYGKKVFSKSGYSNWKHVYETLYLELCAYTHTKISLENAKMLFEDFNGCSEPTYNKEKTLECIHYIQEVLVVECYLMEAMLKEVYGIEDAEYASIFKNNHVK